MNIEIANRLIELRKKKGLSQEDLAASLGISRQSVSKWERAESSPDTDNLICLAKIYGVSLDDLLKTDQSIDDIIKDQEASNECSSTTKEDKKTSGIHINNKGIHIFDEEDDTNVRIDHSGVHINTKEDIENKIKLCGDLNIHKRKQIKSILDSLLWLTTIVCYISFGAIFNMWGNLWYIFFLPLSFSSFVDIILKKNFNSFVYPIFITGLYLLLCLEYGFAWHPYWILFLTIPAYYIFADLLNRIFNFGKYNKYYDIYKDLDCIDDKIKDEIKKDVKGNSNIDIDFTDKD